MAVLYLPDTPIHYGRDNKDYNDDWVHFTMTAQDHQELFSQVDIPLNTPTYPCDFQQLSGFMQLLAQDFRSSGAYSAKIQDALIRSLLFTWDQELKKGKSESQAHKYYAAFSRLRTRIYNAPSLPWSVNEMAKELNVSISYFQHLYKAFFNCSCQQDVIQGRLELAKRYLVQSEMTIYNLAMFCGYENELHFMRQFKKYENMTPTEYRKNTGKVLSVTKAKRSHLSAYKLLL